MKVRFHQFAIASALGIAAASAFAGQQFGRDSVFVTPGQVIPPSSAAQVSRAGRDSVYATQQTGSPASAGASDTARFGRDSVYAMPSSTPTTPLAADAQPLQQFGRDSVYATPGTASNGGTTMGRASSDGSGG